MASDEHTDRPGERPPGDATAAGETLGAAFEAAPQAMMLVDSGTIVRALNRAARELTGHPDDAIAGLSFGQLIGCQTVAGGEECGRGPTCSTCPAHTLLLRTFETGGTSADIQGRFTIDRGDGPLTEELRVSTSLLPTPEGPRALLTVERPRFSTREAHLRKVLTAIRNVQQIVITESDRRRLIECACASLTETMGYFSTWIMLLDEEGRAATMTAAAGPGLEVELSELTRRLERGEYPPCVRAALATEGIVETEDPSASCPDCPLAGDYGDRAGLALRLSQGDRVYGVLGVSVHVQYVREVGEHDCLRGLAGDLALALRRIEDRETLQESERRFRGLFDNSINAVALHELVHDDEGEPVDCVVVQANPAFEEHTGLRVADIIGKRATEIYPSIRDENLIERFGEVVRTGEPARFEIFSEVTLHSYQMVAYRTGRTRFASVFHDITERRRVEAEREITLHLLQILGRASDRHDLIREVANLMREWSGCEAVGVRMREGADYPYFETRGFPEEFVEAERELCARDPRGEPLRDGDGIPVLECICGTVIGGRFDPALPHFTENGSFWTNSTSELFDSADVTCGLSRIRGRCPREGYESVALIPVRHGDSVAGLLQFNDHRPGLFDADRIAFLERLASNLAMGLAQRETARALRESEATFRALVEASPLCILLLRDGEYAFANRASALRLGYEDPEEIIGLTPFDCIAPEYHEDTRERLARIYRGEDNPPFEHGYLRRDGEARWAISTSVSVQMQGKPTAIIVSQDITERKQAERAVEEQLRFRQSLIDAIPVPVFYQSTEGRYLGCNRAMEEFVGAPSEELVGKTTFEIVPSEQAEVYHRRDQELLREPGIQVYENQVVDLRGDVHEVIFHKATFVDEAGEVAGLIGAMIDISELREKEAQFVQAQKMEAVGRLAAGVAHDFNNQLQVIFGYCDMLMVNRSPDDPLGSSLTQIRRAAVRARSTTSHLLAFSRRQVLEPEVVDVAELLMEIEDPMSRMIGEDIELLVDTSDDLPPLFIDRSGLHQAILNLAVNARDAMPDGGTLVLLATQTSLDEEQAAEYPEAEPGSYILLEMIDTGSGIDQRSLDHLFEPFFTTKEPGKGTGLGLPMVLGFIQQSNGFMRVDSKSGAGTTVRLLLPEASADQLAEERETRVPGGRRAGEGGTILVVEDEVDVRFILVRQLATAGYEVLSAGTPSEALELMRGDGPKPDLVVSDVIMPEMRGDELALELKRIRVDLEFLFVTGYSDIEMGGHEPLMKPFAMEELLERVRRSMPAPAAKTE